MKDEKMVEAVLHLQYIGMYPDGRTEAEHRSLTVLVPEKIWSRSGYSQSKPVRSRTRKIQDYQCIGWEIRLTPDEFLEK